MSNVLYFKDYKKKKPRQKLIASHGCGIVTTEEGWNGSEENLAKVRDSINKINSLFEKLKHLNMEDSKSGEPSCNIKNDGKQGKME